MCCVLLIGLVHYMSYVLIMVWCGVINLVLAIEVFYYCDWKCLVVLLIERLSWFSTSFMICCLKEIHDLGVDLRVWKFYNLN